MQFKDKTGFTVIIKKIQPINFKITYTDWLNSVNFKYYRELCFIIRTLFFKYKFDQQDTFSSMSIYYMVKVYLQLYDNFYQEKDLGLMLLNYFHFYSIFPFRYLMLVPNGFVDGTVLLRGQGIVDIVTCDLVTKSKHKIPYKNLYLYLRDLMIDNDDCLELLLTPE
ncbi:hypothetical protein HK103_003078 [Boothiomyces macroporosus]|uniref:Uncharacterized protein n=1 Tax=Boothiomyces macroporosus TaxID=261099 RepID=A0AAD5Y2C4_9FUNG|nr:hypothetical protein HK103_003078 [Boothiomyces macroporosus]